MLRNDYIILAAKSNDPVLLPRATKKNVDELGHAKSSKLLTADLIDFLF